MYYFIANPTARSGKGKQIWSKVKKQLDLYQIKYQVNFTQHEFHARELAEEISKKPGEKIIVAFGGDGTVNEVLNGIKDFTNTKFGYVPIGSANDFSKGMGLPTKLNEAIESIVHPTKIKEVDVGNISYDKVTQRFGVSSGIGFDAAVCQEAYSSPIKDFLNKFHLGFLTYAVIGVKNVVFYRPTKITIQLDDKEPIEYKRCYMVAAMNVKAEGGGLMWTPNADPTDELLDIFVIGDMPKLKFISILPLQKFQLHTNLNGVDTFRCKKCHIMSEEPLPIHRDGEACNYHTDCTMSVYPQKLKIITK